MNFEPELLKFNNGIPVETAAQMAERRTELLEILRKEAYGKPIPPVPVRGRIVAADTHCACGQAVIEDIRVTCEMDNSTEYTFPLRLYLPQTETKLPLILLANFSDKAYEEYVQPELILQNGFALASICYDHLSQDNADFDDGLAAFFPRTNDGTAAGKLTVWAWGMSRAIDYLLTRDEIDAGNIAVIGHSRLGKTALWCAAQDERIRFACSNDSGCMGAAYHRSCHEGGERLADISRVFPYWFCPNLLNRNGDIEALPFDQHFLLACIAPRCVCVNSANLDAWADPTSEYLSCVGASPAWSLYQKTGLVGEAEFDGEEGCFSDGKVAYFKRRGRHFLGLTDWINYMNYIKQHLNDE